MRILGIGDWNDLGDMYLRLAKAGHDVRVHIADPTAHDILEGLIVRIDDWRNELAWIREAGDDGVIVFETAHDGIVQDQLRRDGYQVIGGCAIAAQVLSASFRAGAASRSFCSAGMSRASRDAN